MKRLLIILVLLSSSLLFAERFDFKITDETPNITTSYGYKSNVTFVEICPINNNVCKVVYSNGITEYFRVGDVFTIELYEKADEYNFDLFATKYKIVKFDYNILTTEIISKEVKGRI